MKQHKNDLKPGPLTESGYNGRSCYQANLPDNDRAQIQQPVEGHLRLITLPRRGSPGIERVKANGASHKGLKLRTKMQTIDQGLIHLYKQVKSPGFQHCLDATEFRRRTRFLETDPVRPEMKVLYLNSTGENPIKISGFLRCLEVTRFRRRTRFLETDPVRPEMEVLYLNSTDEIPIKSRGFLCCLDVTKFRRRTALLETNPARMELNILFANSNDKIPKDRIGDIFLNLALKPLSRNVFISGRNLCHRAWKVKSRLISYFRWRKTMNLPELVVSLKKLESLWRETKSISYRVISLIKMEFTFEAKNRLLEASKLRLCQS